MGSLRHTRAIRCDPPFSDVIPPPAVLPGSSRDEPTRHGRAIRAVSARIRDDPRPPLFREPRCATARGGRVSTAMDNLCHTLVGAALARCGLERRTALGAATLMIGANFPDLDVVAVPLGHSLGWRRGLTHGVPALLVLPFALAAAMLAWDRLVRRRRDPDAAPADPRALVLLGAIAIATHPVLDWMNTYGLRWLMPLSGRWFYGDALFIVDPWLLLLLGGAVLLARAWPRRRGADARRPARALTAVAALYIAGMVAMSRAGERIVRRELAARGIASLDVVMTPELARPLTWGVIVVEGDAYRFGTLRWLARPRFALGDETLPTNAAHPAARAAAAHPDAREMLGWARLPYFVPREGPAGTTVRVDDARYGTGEVASWAAVVVEVPGAAERP
jgi:inner membrane protein